MAYNHGPFLAQALESALAQDFAGRLEIVVADDASTDDTVAVARRFAEAHPGVIRILTQEQNLGPARNFMVGFEACRGRYIAMFDGDDFWIDPGKLRKQVAWMDADESLSLCFTSALECVEDAPPRPDIVEPKGRKRTYGLSDLADWIGIETSTVLLRSRYRHPFPEWFYTAPCGDWSLFLFWAERGRLGWLPDVTSVHRLHGAGIWASMRDDREAALHSNLQMLSHYRAHLGDERGAPFDAARVRRHYDLAHLHADRGEDDKAEAFLAKCLAERSWFDPDVYRNEPLRLLLKLRAPWLDRGLRRLRDRLRGAPPPPPQYEFPSPSVLPAAREAVTQAESVGGRSA